ncbi:MULTISPECIES: hypothetical protein [unclassified Chelatococcus]|uniref:hypothetical protein n=1 Tax=unclassified Chelatococcus TaxID=2638111 RepID=UPI001BD16F67|nr:MULTISPECIES: hypothetical protein [unclassified Chelatococcus]MBS7700525.1 hypothetical protein [Chelatococcus sp. YT9]MBX3556321.1 hypothetical protein [Chelatococcus sp.]
MLKKDLTGSVSEIALYTSRAASKRARKHMATVRQTPDDRRANSRASASLHDNTERPHLIPLLVAGLAGALLGWIFRRAV